MSRILVIEDETHIQKLIEIILKKNGYDVGVASSGEEALQIIAEGIVKRDIPELILLDIMLTGIDGLKVLKKLAEREDTRNISVVLLTSISHQSVVKQGIMLGAKDYLKKPFHPKDLIARVKKFLG